MLASHNLDLSPEDRVKIARAAAALEISKARWQAAVTEFDAVLSTMPHFLLEPYWGAEFYNKSFVLLANAANSISLFSDRIVHLAEELKHIVEEANSARQHSD